MSVYDWLFCAFLISAGFNAAIVVVSWFVGFTNWGSIAGIAFSVAGAVSMAVA